MGDLLLVLFTDRCPWCHVLRDESWFAKLFYLQNATGPRKSLSIRQRIGLLIWDIDYKLPFWRWANEIHETKHRRF